MGTTTERLELLITSKVKDGIDGLKEVGGAADGVGSKIRALDAKFEGVNKGLQSVGLQGVSTGALLAGGIGVGATALAGLAAWTAKGIEKQVELADAVRRVSQVSGLAAEEASRLVEVTGDYGISIETVQTAMFKMSTNVQQSSEKFAQHGIAIKRSKDGAVDLLGTLENVQKAYLKSGDATERNAILMDVFGRAGKQLIPVLTETQNIAQALADVPESRLLDEGDVEAAREYQLAMDDLGDAVDAFQRILGSAAIPRIAEYVAALNQILELGLKVPEAVGKFGAIGDAVTGAFVKSIPVIGPTVGLMGDLGNVLGIGGQKSNEFADAQERVSKATAEVARLAADETTSAAELREAKQELAAAQGDLAGKTEAVAAALKTENDQMRESKLLADQRLGGLAGLLSADLQYQQVLNDRAGKQAELTRLEAEGKQGTLEFEAAKQALAQADIKVVQAAVNVENQLRALKTEVQSGKITQEEYTARIEQLKQKYPELGVAIDGVTYRVGVYHGAVVSIPDHKSTKFDADTAAAEEKINRLIEKITGLKRGSYGVPIGTSGGFEGYNPEGIPGFADGGVVPGPIGAPQLVLAHGGEAVFNPDQLRALARAGVGGGGGASYQINVTVGPGGNPAETGRAIVEAIRAYEDRSGPSWRAA